MEEIELISFQLISAAGNAKSMYVEAIQAAKKKKFEEANQLIIDGTKSLLEGHKAHANLIQQEANGEQIQFSLLLMHAEDQLITTETFKLVAVEFIELYENK